jgi:glycosyltransferase involved in cell wall biosynthesis
MKNLYFFHWPSDLGGADTRLKDLIQGLDTLKKYNLYCIPNDDFRLKEAHNVKFLKDNNVKILSWSELPTKTDGYAIAFCNFRLFSEKWRILKIKEMGLKMIWSNDMMWTTSEEMMALKENLIDVYLFTSQFHKYILESKSPEIKSQTSYILPNYFYPDNYKKIKKKSELKNKFVIGKLSRADLMKFGENFPLFYDKIPVENPVFRIMGWSDQLQKKFNWFNFNEDRWNLLKENQEGIIEFLSQLDLYVFNANHKYIENQTRAMVEAQLLGIPAIAPNYGNFPNIIWHGKNGFIYKYIEEAYEYIKQIQDNKTLRHELETNSLNLSKSIWCNIENQSAHLENIFEICD